MSSREKESIGFEWGFLIDNVGLGEGYTLVVVNCRVLDEDSLEDSNIRTKLLEWGYGRDMDRFFMERVLVIRGKFQTKVLKELTERWRDRYMKTGEWIERKMKRGEVNVGTTKVKGWQKRYWEDKKVGRR